MDKLGSGVIYVVSATHVWRNNGSTVGMVFPLRFVPRCYKQSVELSCVKCSKLVGEWVSELVWGLLGFSLCKLLLLEAGSWGTGTVRESSARGTSAVRCRHQATTDEDTEDCCSELLTAWNSGSLIAICSYNPSVFNKSNYQSKPRLYTWQYFLYFVVGQ
jgi:hypothetical protein